MITVIWILAIVVSFYGYLFCGFVLFELGLNENLSSRTTEDDKVPEWLAIWPVVIAFGIGMVASVAFFLAVWTIIYGLPHRLFKGYWPSLDN